MKTALITGASRGIGAATATLLAQKGYAVAVNYHERKAEAQKVVDSIIAAKGKAIAIAADMGNLTDVARLFETVDKELGPVSALVNNAALNPSGSVEHMDASVLESIFRVNVFGAIEACRLAAKRMGKGGAIVNVTSEAAKFGGNKIAYYAASKAALNTFTVAFSREVAASGIRVNAVSPGVISTDAHANATPERLAALNASLPMGRMGTPEEVAETIAWLLSDAASYVSGSILTVAGAR